MQSGFGRIVRVMAAVAACCAVLCATALAGVAQGALIPLTIGTLPSDGTSLVFYAKDLGIFERNGINATIMTMPNGAAIAAAVAGGTLDIGVSNPGVVAQAREKGILFKFIAPSSVAVRPPAYTDVVMVGSKSAIRTGKDAEGKTVGVSALKNLTQISIEAWVDAHGGDSKTLHYIEIPSGQVAAALESQRIDIAAMTEPFITAARLQGQGRVIADSFESMAPRMMVTGWFSTDAWIAAHEDVASRFATSIRQAAEWANAHQRDSAAILVKHTALTADVVNSMKRARYGLALDPQFIKPVVDAMLHYGALDAPIDVNDLIWQAHKP